MPELKISRTYSDGDILLKTDLDNITEAVETINNTTKYDDANIQDQAIQSQHIIDSSVVTDCIAANAITSVKIVDSNVTSNKILNNEIKTINIADSAVTTSKLGGSITTAKFSTSERLSSSKIVAKYYGTITNPSNTTRASTDVGDATIASLTLSQNISNAFIMLQPMDTDPAYIQALQNSAASGGVIAAINIRIDGTVISVCPFGAAEGAGGAGINFKLPLSSIKERYASFLPTGTVISVTLPPPTKTGSTSVATAVVSKCKLVVLEL